MRLALRTRFRYLRRRTIYGYSNHRTGHLRYCSLRNVCWSHDLLATTTTIYERPIYISGIGLTWGLGTILGPVIGGSFLDSPAGWRWAFYINLCISAAYAPVYLFILHNKDPRLGISLIDRAREIDYVGSILIMGAFVSGAMAVSFGGVTYEWSSGQTIGRSILHICKHQPTCRRACS
jgi:MFS family permease